MKLSLSLSLLAGLAALTSTVTAAAANKDALYKGCDATFSKLTFQCPKGMMKTKCTCNSKEYLASWMDCVSRSHTPVSEQQRAMDTIGSLCQMQGVTVTHQDLHNMLANATTGNYFVPMANVTGKKATLYNPVLATENNLLLQIRTQRVAIFQKYIGHVFGGLILVYWGAVLVAGSIVNLVKKTAPRFAYSLNSPFWISLRKTVALPAAYGHSHSRPVMAFKIFNMAVPTRAQSLVLIGYGVLHLILVCVQYDLFDGNIRYPTKSLQLSRFLGDRTAIMSLYHIPLLILFAGRNNIMLTLTGWSFETMNAYHRWVARGMYINVVIHGIAFTKCYSLQGNYMAQIAQSNNTWGIVAGVLGGLILFFSYRAFRDRMHEFFLIMHWIFVSLFVAGAWWHVKPHGSGYIYLIYASVAVWAFDRAMRIVRVLVSGLTASAQIQLYPHNIMKLKIDYSNWYSVNPGAYVYIHLLKLTCFWQSHPFSAYMSPVPGEEKKMVLAIRARNGITKTYANLLSHVPTGVATIPLLIDGPYGQSYPVHQFDTMVFIAGGIGATATYSYVDSLKRAGLAEKQRVVFIWIVRNRDELTWFREEMDYLTHDGDIEVRVFITHQGTPDPTTCCSPNSKDIPTTTTSLNEAEDEKESNAEKLTDYNATYMLPNIDELVTSYIQESNSNIGILSCGPPGMNDDARASVVKNLGTGSHRVEYFEESFAW